VILKNFKETIIGEEQVRYFVRAKITKCIEHFLLYILHFGLLFLSLLYYLLAMSQARLVV